MAEANASAIAVESDTGHRRGTSLLQWDRPQPVTRGEQDGWSQDRPPDQDVAPGALAPGGHWGAGSWGISRPAWVRRGPNGRRGLLQHRALWARGVLLQLQLQPLRSERRRLHARTLPSHYYASDRRNVRQDDVPSRTHLLQRKLRHVRTARSELLPGDLLLAVASTVCPGG